jgi:hypothetical protein
VQVDGTGVTVNVECRRSVMWGPGSCPEVGVGGWRAAGVETYKVGILIQWKEIRHRDNTWYEVPILYIIKFNKYIAGEGAQAELSFLNVGVKNTTIYLDPTATERAKIQKGN